MKKLFKSKKAIAPMVLVALLGLIPFFLIIVLGGTASIKWMFMDKTPIIIGGIFLFLILFKQKRAEGSI